MNDFIRSTNLRFNLKKETQRRAWEYLQTMNKAEFKSYSHAIAVAVVDTLTVIIKRRMTLILRRGSVRNASSPKS